MTATPPNRVVASRQFSATVAEVYEAWTEPEIMRRWLTPGPNIIVHVEAHAVVGGALLIRSQSPDGTIHVINGMYRELMPGRRIAMTWSYTGPFALICGMETLIEIDLRADSPERTTMVFTQSRFTSSEAAAAYEGDWPSCFDKLSTVLALPSGQKQ